ncbi:MAG: MFS transporter [Bacteroidota bacterium]|nr:MFS transporter [Bacteroidota bacterium]
MSEHTPTKPHFRDYPPTFWLVVLFEFFERGSYYGMMSILSVYLTDKLGYTKESVGLIKSTIQPLLYFLPIITGAIADRMGYRRTLMAAFSLLGIGYFLTSATTDYATVFASLVVMGIGAGTFKPIISGTIAKVTDERTSTLGFGIFYWSINLGAFLFPLILVPILKSISWHLVMVASAVCTGMMVIPTFLFFREPASGPRVSESLGRTLSSIGRKIWVVLLDWRFILFIFIYSWFWILYFQMFDSVLWYVKDFIDASPLNDFIRSVAGFSWSFDIEHVTVLNAMTIITLQMLVSSLVSKTRALPTMITGAALATAGMAILSFSPSIWIFLAGIIVFSIGEMTAHPKYISYLGLIAPEDKKATYMGFGFLYGVFGSSIGGVLGANLYVRFIDNPMIAFVRQALAERGTPDLLPQGATVSDAVRIAGSIGITKADLATHAHPSTLWLIFSGIGVLCIIGLLLYQKAVAPRSRY